MKVSKTKASDRKKILSLFKEKTQSYQILNIVASRKNVLSHELLSSIGEDLNISEIVRSRINPKLEQHGLSIFADRVHGTKHHTWNLYKLGGAN